MTSPRHRWARASALVPSVPSREDLTRWSRPATVILGIASLVWLGYELWRLLFQPVPAGATDLAQRHNEISAWFSGQTVYGEFVTAVYPPASYLVLWPLLGWLELPAARWLWALTTGAALVLLVRITIAECEAGSRKERTFVALLPLAIYPTGATIGNGQLTIHALLALLASLLLLRRPPAWQRDVSIAALAVLALVKPTLSAPFFLVLAFAPGGLRPACLTVLGYVATTLAAAAFQDEELLPMLAAFLDGARNGIEWGTARDGYANQASWLAELGRGHLHVYGAVLAALIVGAWIFWQRKKDLWLLIGTTAILTRFATYHAWYDDLLILFPLISLYRVARGATDRRTLSWAGGLFLLTLASLLAPGGRYLLPSPWESVHGWFQVAIWLSTLAYLVLRTSSASHAKTG